MARSLKYRINKEEELYYPCGENKGADQLRSYAELICAYVFAKGKKRFSHEYIIMAGKEVFTFELLVKIYITELQS